MRDLPIEIIEHIIENTTNSTKIECICTRRLWYVLFYRYLLHSVTITTRRRFKSFLQLLEKYGDEQLDSNDRTDIDKDAVDSLTAINTKHRIPIGHFVRELRLTKRIGITKEQFKFIGHHCPNLEIFDFNNWRHYYPSALEPFKQIKQIPPLFYPGKSRQAVDETRNTLTHLHIQQRMFHTLRPPCTLLSFVGLVGNTLTHLTIDGSYDYQEDVCEFELNPAQLETLHHYCKQLTYIKFSTISLAAEGRDVSEITYTLEREARDQDEFLIVPSMKQLILRGLRMDDPAWLPYLAIKYPNLHTLHINFAIDAFVSYLEGQTYVLDPDTCLEAFSHLSYKIPTTLKYLSITDVTASHFDGEDFFYNLGDNGVKLNRLDLHYKVDFFPNPERLANRHAITSDILWAMISKREISLRSLKMDIWVGASRNFQEFLHPISLCTNLKELCLASDEYGRFNFNPYPVDEILDACRGLTSLRLARTSVVVNDKHSAKERHPLRKLDVAVSCVSSDLFEYLARRCPDLKHLTLDTDTWMPRQLEMKINMPNHSFEYVHINEMNNLHTPMLEGNLGRGTRVNFFAITQMDRIERKLERYLRRLDKVNDEGTLKHPPRLPDGVHSFTDLYHLYESERRMRLPFADVRKLHDDEVKAFWDLLQYYQANLHKVRVPVSDDEERLDRYLPRRAWQADVRYGFMHLLCKSVKTFRYHFNELHWPELQ